MTTATEPEQLYPADLVRRHMTAAIDRWPLSDQRQELRDFLRRSDVLAKQEITADQIMRLVSGRAIWTGLADLVPAEGRRNLIEALATAMDECQAELEGTAPEPDDGDTEGWIQHCQVCGQRYRAFRPQSRFCSDTCRKRHQRAALSRQEARTATAERSQLSGQPAVSASRVVPSSSPRTGQR